MIEWEDKTNRAGMKSNDFYVHKMFFHHELKVRRWHPWHVDVILNGPLQSDLRFVGQKNSFGIST